MTDENVKIIINEKDNTSGGGRGIDSTDIAFVPGFTVNAEATLGEPILFTDVRAFEKEFGKSPVVFTAKHCSEYSKNGFTEADTYDRGYIYAKELLNMGLPVMYCAMSSSKTAPIDATFTGVTASSVKDDGQVIPGLYDLPLKNNNDKEYASYTFTFDPDKAYYSVHVNGKLVSHKETVDTETATVTAEVTFPRDTNTTRYNIELNYLENSLDAFYKTETKYDENGKVVSIKYDTDNIAFNNILAEIADKSVYSVKYITSGGYPSIDSVSANVFAQKMMEVASERGDAVALIDYVECADETPFGDNSFYTKINNLYKNDIPYNDVNICSFGTMMYPWASYSCPSTLASDARVSMPASFAYLKCLASAIKTSPNFLAMAGVSRGVVSNIDKLYTPGNKLSNTDAENMQPKMGTDENKVSVNCITNVRPYGLTLWGNRTLKPVGKDGCVALNFLNTRNMISDVKKLLYTTAKTLMFEQDSDTLWIKFKSGISPLLNQLKMGNGISDYKIIKGTTKYNGDPLQKGEVSAVIKIYPLYAIEYFELTVEINDQEVVVS